MKKGIGKFLFIVILFFGLLLFTHLIWAAPVRGLSGDFWADNIIGKPDFSEITGNSVVPNKVYVIHGTIVDRNIEGDEKLYAYDSMDNRIMGINLNSCLAGGNPLNCSASIIIGQPNMNTSACNGDSGFQNFPNRAPASASSLCTEQESQLSISEGGSGSSMAVDGAGSLYVTDFWNNRVLKYLSPFTTDQVADDVWGQTNFVNNSCNNGLASPTASSLCFTWGNSNNWTAGVDVDTAGNVWVVDSGNNRVLRFPPGSKIADLVLGQSDFVSNSSGAGLNQLNAPSAVRVNASGRVYVADQGNNRVLIFDTPATGTPGQVFGSGFLAPAGLDFDPTQAGIWIANTNDSKATIELWSETLPISKIKQIGNPGDANVLYGASGSIGINRAGDLFPGIAGGNYGRDVLVYLKGGDLVYPSNKLFGQDNNANQINLYGIGSGKGVTVSDDQLQVLDENGRIMFWNGLASLTKGKVASGSIQAGIGSIGGLSVDANHHLYVTIVKDPDNLIQIQVYDLPLTSGAVPIHTIGTKVDAYILSLPLLGGGTVLLSQFLWGLVPTPDGNFLWVSDPVYNRVMRIRDPLTSPVVDIILGQVNSSGTLCNRNGLDNPADATATTLCKPGSLSLDRLGNLYVSDHSLEIQGNYRLLEFNSALFPTNNVSVIYAPPASKIFPEIATWQPAFDSQNRMVVGYNPYKDNNLDANPNGGWFPGIYNDPLSGDSFLPNAHLNDYYSMAFSAVFDSNDNLYVSDLNRSRVLIYKSPFNITPTVDAGIDQTITLPSTTTLAGTASDDGIPASPGLTINWTKVSGSGTVIFSDASNLNTTATFDSAGTYILRLTASDSEFSVNDDIVILVNEEPSSGGGGGGGGGGNKKPKSNSGTTCLPGQTFSPITGKLCLSNGGSVLCILGQIFSPITGQKCTTFTSPNKYEFGTILIKQGSRGLECKAWQMFFNNHLNTQLVLDGVCGPKTIAVARTWQASVELIADGLLGAMSRAKANTQ